MEENEQESQSLTFSNDEEMESNILLEDQISEDLDSIDSQKPLEQAVSATYQSSVTLQDEFDSSKDEPSGALPDEPSGAFPDEQSAYQDDLDTFPDDYETLPDEQMQSLDDETSTQEEQTTYQELDFKEQSSSFDLEQKSVLEQVEEKEMAEAVKHYEMKEKRDLCSYSYDSLNIDSTEIMNYDDKMGPCSPHVELVYKQESAAIGSTLFDEWNEASISDLAIPFVPQKEVEEIPYEKDERVNKMIQVQITKDGEKGIVNVLMDYSEEEDLYFIGGYKHIRSGLRYYNAPTQTEHEIPKRIYTQSHRETQTTPFGFKFIQTHSSNASTQLFRHAISYIPSYNDKIISPTGNFTSAEDIASKKLEKTLVIQKWMRRFLAQKKLKWLAEETMKRLKWEKIHEMENSQNSHKLLCDEVERISNPKNKTDFEFIFWDLENWRRRELEKLDETRCGAERKAALCGLLEEESDTITSLNYKRINLIRQKNDLHKVHCLNKISKPKFFRSYRNLGVHMDTLFTQRARYLREIYCSMEMEYLSKDERFDILNTLIDVVKVHECPLTKEIITLAEREMDLIRRGIKLSSLIGLRRRITNLFWQFVRNPCFNPESKAFSKMPSDPLVYRKCVARCQGCYKYFMAIPSKDASSALQATKGRNKCEECLNLQNEAVQRLETSLYQAILEKLRVKERQLGTTTGIVFFLQKTDIAYLIDKIWGGQSALGGQNDLHILSLPRWHKEKEWSPWNTILMTEEEAFCHFNLFDLKLAYKDSFINRIEQRNHVAKTYFQSLQRLMPYLNEYIMYPRTIYQKIPGVKNKEVTWATPSG